MKKNSRFKVATVRFTQSLIAAMAAVVLVASPASAAEYRYSADFYHQLDSRSFWTGDSGDVYASFNCVYGHGKTYTMTLRKNVAGVWFNAGSQTFTCDDNRDAVTFESTPLLLHKIRFTTENTGTSITGAGYLRSW